MARSKQIIISNPRTSYYIGGAEMVSIEHAKEFKKLGYEVFFFSINPQSINLKYSKQYSKFKSYYQNTIHFIEINLKDKIRTDSIYKIEPGENRNRWNFESILYNQELYSVLLRDFGSDCFDFILSYFALDCVIKPKNINNNILYLCGIPREFNFFRHTFLFMYDKIFAINDATKDYWSRYTVHNITTVSTGVDTERFTLRLRAQRGYFNISFIGRLIERKGCELLIHAISQLEPHYLSKINTIFIIGDGPQKNHLIRLVFDYGLSEIIKFTGIIDNPETYYKKTDILISPSLRGEGIQGVLLEAVSSGCFIIATNTQSNYDLLKNGNGILLNSLNINEIKKSIEKILDNPSIINDKKIRKASLYVKNNYSWSKKVKTLKEEMEK